MAARSNCNRSASPGTRKITTAASDKSSEAQGTRLAAQVENFPGAHSAFIILHSALRTSSCRLPFAGGERGDRQAGGDQPGQRVDGPAAAAEVGDVQVVRADRRLRWGRTVRGC